MAGRPGGEAPPTFEVRVWAVTRVEGVTGHAYRLRWEVARRRRSKTFPTRALAESTRAELMAASRRGEAFDIVSGLPLARVRRTQGTTWWNWSLAYVDLKWPTLAPISRRSLAEALIDATLHLSAPAPNRPPVKDLRHAMFVWGYHAPHRAAVVPSAEVSEALRWLDRSSLPLVQLEDPSVGRALLNALSRRQDGTPAAPTTVARKRAVIHNALELAVEHRHLDSNPIAKLRWKAPRAADTFDSRSVINPQQARALLVAVSEQGDKGRRLTAFFALMYYAALRPSEATAVILDDLVLPEGPGWGELHLARSNAEISGKWADSGRRGSRQLKHRAQGHVRVVPLPPPLVEHLRSHIAEYNVRAGGRLFRGPQGGTVAARIYSEVWQQARKAAFTPAEQASPMARRPYDLRHTAVSTWLAAGVDSAQVAAWAGHSVAVLHRVYAHVVFGRADVARGRIEDILGR